MKITFQKIIFRNFLSYGNKETVLELSTPGLISLSGANGCGKSSFLDAITFALYGKPYRKVKINQLLNRKNKKNLFVQVYFQQNLVDYRITRTLHPNSIKIEKRDPHSKDYVDQELLSSKALDQEEIDKIFGIDFNTFKHIVAIASSASHSKPFLALSAGDKRRLIESVFNLEMIGDLMKLVKMDKSENKSKLLNASNSVSLYTSMLAQLIKQFDSSKEAIENFTKRKEADLELILDKISNTKNEVNKLQARVDGLEQFIDRSLYDSIDLGMKELVKERETLNHNIGECNARIKHAEKILDSLNNNDICPSCNTNITETHRKMEQNNFSSVIRDAIAERKDMRNQIKIVDENYADKQKSLEDMQQVKSTYQSLKTKITSLLNNIEEYEQEFGKKSNEDLNINIDVTKQLIDDNNKNLESSNEELSICSDREIVLDITDYLLSDNGIKTEFYNIITPIFNNSVNDYLTKFELPYILTFNHEFDYTIQSIQNSEEEINYYSFSEGEKKRIDISVLLTFIKISKKISNWNANFLVFDEIFDGGIDSEGLTLILDTVKKIVADEQLTTFIISHKLSDHAEIFDRNIVVTKEDGFSKIEFQ